MSSRLYFFFAIISKKCVWRPFSILLRLLSRLGVSSWSQHSYRLRSGPVCLRALAPFKGRLHAYGLRGLQRLSKTNREWLGRVSRMHTDEASAFSLPWSSASAGRTAGGFRARV